MAAGRSVVVAPVPAGRDAAVPGEGPVESALGRVADGLGDLGRWLGALPELAGGQFHPPAGEIAVRWLADVLGEVAGQGGAGNVYGAGQVLERPVTARTDGLATGISPWPLLARSGSTGSVPVPAGPMGRAHRGTGPGRGRLRADPAAPGWH